MIQTLPLLGKRILVPRGKNEAKNFSALVEKYGGIPMEIPLIAFRPIVPSEEIKELLNQVHTYDWIIFTSNVTVETFLSFYQNQSIQLPKIAVIGKRTANVLKKKGYDVSFIPNEFVAEGFVRDFIPHIHNGMKVFIPKGNLARDYIGESLVKAGASVREVVVYETYLPEESKFQLKEVITKKEIDILTFTSPSTVEHFMEVIDANGLHKKLDHCLVSCIGPVTKEKLESIGLRVNVIPGIYTVEEMLKNIILYLRKTI